MPAEHFTRRRVIYFDILRIVAIFFVVFVHLAAQHWADVDVSSRAWFAFNLYCTTGKWSVPIFVMISGALFLRRDVSISAILKKNVARIATVFLFWSGCYALVYLVFRHAPLSVVLSQFITGHYHLWFLYMIVGLYLLIPLLVTHFPWRVSFLVPAALTLLTGLGWIAVGATTRGCYQTPEKVETKNTVKATESFRALYLVSGLPLLLAIILFMGLLKDGIMTWVPQEMTDTFQIDAALSIFLTAILPLVNLAGLWLIQKLSKRPGSDDVRTSFLLFGAAGAGMLLLVAVGRLHPLLTVLLFSAVSLCVSGINTVLISLVPLQFAKAGRSSTVAGLTNAFTYLGSALSGWGLGLAAGQWGWNAVNWLLFGLCAAGMGLCLAVRPLWRRFLGL